MRNDIAREAPVEPGYAREQGGRGRIDINPNGVDAIFDDGIKRPRQIPLVQIMLVLTDADGLGLDLDQLGKRILQATRNRDGPPDAHVEIRELVGRKLGGRVHGCAGLGHDDACQLQVGLRGHQLGDQLFRLPRGGAVADRDQVDLVAAGDCGQRDE